MLVAVGALLTLIALVVLGARLIARKEVTEEAASRLGVDLTAAFAKEPGLRDAAILPIATIPLEARPSVVLSGRVPSAAARDLALAVARRETERLRPGTVVIDRLEVAPSPAGRRLA